MWSCKKAHARPHQKERSSLHMSLMLAFSASKLNLKMSQFWRTCLEKLEGLSNSTSFATIRPKTNSCVAMKEVISQVYPTGKKFNLKFRMELISRVTFLWPIVIGLFPEQIWYVGYQ